MANKLANGTAMTPQVSGAENNVAYTTSFSGKALTKLLTFQETVHFRAFLQ